MKNIKAGAGMTSTKEHALGPYSDLGPDSGAAGIKMMELQGFTQAELEWGTGVGADGTYVVGPIEYPGDMTPAPTFGAPNAIPTPPWDPGPTRRAGHHAPGKPGA